MMALWQLTNKGWNLKQISGTLVWSVRSRSYKRVHWQTRQVENTMKPRSHKLPGAPTEQCTQSFCKEEEPWKSTHIWLTVWPDNRSLAKPGRMSRKYKTYLQVQCQCNEMLTNCTSIYKAFSDFSGYCFPLCFVCRGFQAENLGFSSQRAAKPPTKTIS